MSHLEIEQIGPDDELFLLEMLILSLRSLPNLARKSQLELEGIARLEIGSWVANRDYAFVAHQNFQRAGAIWLKGYGESTARHYELGLAVAPTFQKQGVGTGLMEYALQFCTNHAGSSLGLKVYPGNLPALRLYHHFGFEEITLEMRKKL